MKVLSYIISPEFVYMWIRVATPIIFSSLGGVICSRAGVVNLGLEGIMLISALAGVLGSAFGGSLLWGMVAGLAAALAVSALFAYFHLVLKANNVLCGTAVNTMASGLTVFVLQLATGEKGNSSSLKSFAFPQVNIPVIKDIPVLGSIISGHNALTYFALLMVFVIWFFLYKTPMGLRMRAVGENPDAASSVGQNVTGIRFLAILLCGDRSWRYVSFHGLSDHVCTRHDSRPRLYRPGGMLHGTGNPGGRTVIFHDLCVLRRTVQYPAGTEDPVRVYSDASVSGNHCRSDCLFHSEGCSG